jgi:hypothetical protein
MWISPRSIICATMYFCRLHCKESMLTLMALHFIRSSALPGSHPCALLINDALTVHAVSEAGFNDEFRHVDSLASVPAKG